MAEKKNLRAVGVTGSSSCSTSCEQLLIRAYTARLKRCWAWSPSCTAVAWRESSRW